MESAEEIGPEEPEEEPQEPRGPSWIRRLVTWLPAWVTATLLVTLLTGIEFLAALCDWTWKGRTWEITVHILILCAFFLPGALKRWNWRHILVMLAAGALAEGWIWAARKLHLNVPFPYDLAVWGLTYPLFVALGEWLLMKQRSLRALAAALVAVGAASCLMSLILKPIAYANLHHRFEFPSRSLDVSLAGELHWPLQALIVWVAIPLALQAGTGPGRRRLAISLAATGACIAGFFLFFLVGVYPLAERSLEGHGPFEPGVAALLLETRGRASDYEALWRQVELSDWTNPRYDVWPENPYGKTFLAVAMRLDPAETAGRLADLLRKNPTEALAKSAALFLARHNRIEVAPILYWHALNIFDSAGDECKEAMETMDLPWSIIVLIVQIPRNPRFEDHPPVNPTLTARERAVLTRLAGKDLGEKYSSWVAPADQLIEEAAARFPDPIRKDMDAVTHCAIRYFNLSHRRYEAQCRLFVLRLDRAGLGDLTAQIARRKEALEEERRELGDYAFGNEMAQQFPGFRENARLMDETLRSARTDMDVPPPLWRQEGVAALEEEVDRYARALDEKIARFLPAPPPPATRPSTAPANPGG